MLRLTYSDQLELLADALADKVAAVRIEHGPFAPLPIVIPNQAVGEFIKLGLAKRLGIAIHIEMPFLESFLGRVVVGKAGASKRVVLDRSTLQVLLSSVLSDADLLSRSALSQVADYLTADDGSRELRQFQLADRLAALFLDYELSRPEMTRAWRAGRLVVSDGEMAATELWQQRLYVDVFGRSGKLASLDGSWDTLPGHFNRLRPAELHVPQAAFIFGFSYVAVGYQQMYARIGEACQLDIFAINPCREFWEDIADEEGETPALRHWGRPGRESIRLHSELTGFDFSECFSLTSAEASSASQLTSAEASSPRSVLASLQADIVARAPERTSPSAGEMTTDIVVLACPSPRRELEVIANEIWRLMTDDPTLQFNDIAVLINPEQADVYMAHVGAVFDELHEIPYSATDLPFANVSRAAEAFELLLALPTSRFTRPELLRVLTHPAVVSRYPDVEPSDWVVWAERLAIVHGADREDHQGTYIEGDVFHWDQGLRRLALGAFMAGQQSGERQTISLGDRTLVPEELSAGSLRSAAQFALLARSLIADARFARDARMPLSRWAKFLDALASSYLHDEDRHVQRCRSAASSLRALDVDGRAIGFVTAREIVRARLRSLRGSRGDYLARGVVVSPLSAMRPLPFRVVFCVGLGEGSFPASDRPSPLDLRSLRRCVGDVSARERDRYTFLETLLATKHKLFLSYVSRDERTGEPLMPSSLVSELCTMLSKGYLDQQGVDSLVAHHPLRRYDPRYFPQLFSASTVDGEDNAPLYSVDPIGHRQARAWSLRHHLEQRGLEERIVVPDLDTLRAGLSASDVAVLDTLIAKPHLHANPTTLQPMDDANDTDVVTLSASTVRRFLESPLQAWASNILQLREVDYEDQATREDEPFHTKPHERTMLLRRVFVDALRTGADFQQAYSEQVALLAAAGIAPHGIFGEIQTDADRAVLSAWHDILTTGTGSGLLTVHGFGRARENVDIDALHPPIVLDVGGRIVELYGTTEPVVAGHGSVVLVTGRIKESHRLRGIVDHLLLAAAGINESEHGIIVASGQSRVERWRLAAWSAAEAKSHLETLVADLITSSHEYLLPCEVVFDHHADPAVSLDRQLAKRRSGTYPRLSCIYGPVRDIDRLSLPRNAGELIERRFGPILARLDRQDG